MSLAIDSSTAGPLSGPLPGSMAASGLRALRPEVREPGSLPEPDRDAAAISEEARELLREVSGAEESEDAGRHGAEEPDGAETAAGPRRGPGEDLTPEEEREVQELDRRDREVRAHEQAHAAAGGAHVRGGPSYEFEVGPDGQRYAVNGHVSIDVSPERDPRATIRKMQQVKQAATAPANPSASDRRVAAKAAAEEAKARQQLMEESGSGSSEGEAAASPSGSATPRELAG